MVGIFPGKEFCSYPENFAWGRVLFELPLADEVFFPVEEIISPVERETFPSNAILTSACGEF